MTLLFLAILFSRYFICLFFDKFSSNKTPGNVTHRLFRNRVFFNAGRGDRIVRFLPDLLNNESLVFPTFKDSLVPNHQVRTWCDLNNDVRKR